MKEEAFNTVKTQAGPCGITCGTCVLGNGTIAETAAKTKTYIEGYGIKEWAPLVPGGAQINWTETEKTLEWMTKYAGCQGCEKGGGPQNCAIRLCANQKTMQLCTQCSELDVCDKFDWLGDYSATLKQKLSQNKGKTKEEYIADALKDL